MTRRLPNGSILPLVEQTLQRIGRGSCADIEWAGNMKSDASRPALTELHASGAVHIAEWTRPIEQTAWRAVWAWGPGLDAPRPLPKSKTPKVSPFRDDMGERTAGLPMDYPMKSIFVGGVNPWGHV